MTRRTIAGLRALITGASSGIGQAIAVELGRRRGRTLLTARRSDRLEQVAGEIRSLGAEASFVTGDITDPATREKLIESIQANWGALDLLINNAGIGAIGPFQTADPTRLRTIMEVNFFAPLELMRLTLPLLAKGTKPMMVNIGSVLGHRAVPLKSEYCASKFALHGFTDAIRAELSARHIDVLLVSPSTTESEFSERLIEKQASQPWRTPYPMSAAKVAQKTANAIERGSHEIILTWGGRFIVWLDRLAPTLTDRLIAHFS
jgi:short-subunit dehydrogenase